MNVKQKLANILGDFESQEKIADLWKDVNGADVKKVRLVYDLETGSYQVESLTHDSNGTVEHDFKLNTKAGEAVETIKNLESGSEKVIESTVNMTSLRTPEPVPQSVVDAINSDAKTTAEAVATSKIPVQTQASTTTAPAVDTVKASSSANVSESSMSSMPPMTWEEIEMQRDVAFKVINFFIGFIIATFGLLYAYCRMSKKESLEQERKARAKNIFYGEPTQQTFFDFLATQNE